MDTQSVAEQIMSGIAQQCTANPNSLSWQFQMSTAEYTQIAVKLTKTYSHFQVNVVSNEVVLTISC